MKWDSATPEELTVVNEHLRCESLELDTACSFKRYARRQGESDTLVHFQSGVTLRLLKVDPIHYRSGMPGTEAFYLTFYEPGQQLFLKVNDNDFRKLFTAESHELLGSTMLWAIKQANKSELSDGDDPDFGAYS